MATYRIHRDMYDYDEYDAFVVISESVTEAAEMIWSAYGGGRSWLGVKTFEEFLATWRVTLEDKPGIILGSFNAG